MLESKTEKENRESKRERENREKGRWTAMVLV